MATDIIISCYATSPKFQPLTKFRHQPKLIAVPKPYEAWGGKPYDELAVKLKQQGGGSVLKGLLASRAPGVDPRRVAVIGFSAGNTMVRHLIAREEDRALIDTVISLDGMTYPKGYDGKPINTGPKGFGAWVDMGARAAGIERMASGRNPYKGPMMVVSYTNIPSGAPKHASSTQEAAANLLFQLNDRYYAAQRNVSQAYIRDQDKAQKIILARLRKWSQGVPLPIEIYGGNPPSKKVWAAPPWPQRIGFLGNLWTFNWGGQTGPDHIFQARWAQQAIWESFLIPRWNARSSGVAGLGDVDWTTPAALNPGGGLVAPGTLRSGVNWAAAGMAGVAGFLVGKWLIDNV